MTDIRPSEVARRLDETYGEIDNRTVAELIRSRTNYRTSHETVRLARNGMKKKVPRELVAATAAAFGVSEGWLLTGERDETAPTGEAVSQDPWAAMTLEAIRYQSGEGVVSAETRRVQADVLRGLILLGRQAGKDVRALETALKELGPIEDVEAESAATILAIYAGEVRAAERRAAGLERFGRAAELEAEEARERRREREAGVTPPPLDRDMQVARAAIAYDKAFPAAPKKGPPPGAGNAG